MTMTTGDPSLLGTTTHWDLHDTTTGESFSLDGVLLGYSSSHQHQHNHDGNRPGQRPCQACRWFEVQIIASDDGKWYLVAYDGRTTVPGETDRRTVVRTASPYTVIEVLTQQRDGASFIPKTSRIALSEAAARDQGIEQAWVDRAV